MSKALRIAALERELAELRAQPEPTYGCAICRITPEEINEPLTDVTVITADGEEGYSNITLLLCNDDLIHVTDELQKLGFSDHRHGSTSLLEDPDCPGFEYMESCPNPTHYGNVTWGRVPPQDEEA